MRYLLLISFILLSACESKDKIRVFISWKGTSDMPIYSWNNDRSTFTGSDPEIIELLLNDANIDFKYVFPETKTAYTREEV